MAGTEYFGETAVQPRDHIPVTCCQHHAEITQSHTFAALVRLFTTTHNLLLTQAKYYQMIDPFTQMKREYNTILDDADLLRIAFSLSLLRALHDALRETFFEVTNNEM